MTPLTHTTQRIPHFNRESGLSFVPLPNDEKELRKLSETLVSHIARHPEVLEFLDPDVPRDTEGFFHLLQKWTQERNYFVVLATESKSGAQIPIGVAGYYPQTSHPVKELDSVPHANRSVYIYAKEAQGLGFYPNILDYIHGEALKAGLRALVVETNNPRVKDTLLRNAPDGFVQMSAPVTYSTEKKGNVVLERFIVWLGRNK